MSFGRKRRNLGKSEKIKLTKDSYSKAKNFLAFVKPYAPIYFIGFIFLLLSSGVSASLPIFLGQILGAEASEFTSEWNFDASAPRICPRKMGRDAEASEFTSEWNFGSKF